MKEDKPRFKTAGEALEQAVKGSLGDGKDGSLWERVAQAFLASEWGEESKPEWKLPDPLEGQQWLSRYLAEYEAWRAAK